MGRLLLKTPAEIEKEKPVVEVDSFEAFKSGFALQNPLAEPIMNYDQPSTEDVPGYSPYDEVEEIEGYDPSYFTSSNSPTETEQIKSSIDRERTMRKEAGSDGFGMVGEVAGAITNPIIWGGLLMPQMGLPALIATEVGLEAISETILQTQQYERTLAESAINVATAGVATYGISKVMAARADWATAKRADLDGDTYSGVPDEVTLKETYDEMHGANMKGEEVDLDKYLRQFYRDGEGNAPEYIPEPNLTELDQPLTFDNAPQKEDLSGFQVEDLKEFETVEVEPQAMPEFVSSGPMTAKITPIGDPNTIIYRETGADDLGSLLSDNNQGIGVQSFVTDDPDLAISQNKYGAGVLIEFRGDRVSGVEHKKPGTGIVGGREYTTNYIGQNSIQKVTIGKGIKLPYVAKSILQSKFEREVMGDGSRVFTPKKVYEEREIIAPEPLRAEHVEVVDQGVDRAGQESGGGTTGAMKADQTTIEDVTPVGSKSVMKLAVGPLKDLLKSPVKEVRELGMRLAENPFITKGMMEGKTLGVPMEALIKTYAGKEATATYEMARRFKEYKSRVPNDGEKLNQVEFDQATGVAMSNGDKSAIPEVQAAAKFYRDTIIDPLMKEAQDLDLLPKTKDWFDEKIAKATDPEEIANLTKLRDKAEFTLTQFAQSYFPRIYDRNLINENYADIKNLIVTKFRNGDEFTAEEVEDAAVTTIRNMMGGSPIGQGFSKSAKDSSLKKRVLELEDNDLQPFLEKRASVVVGKHAQGLGPHIEFKKKFEDFADTLDDINIRYDELIDRAKDAKERKAITADREKVASGIKTIKDRIMGDTQISLDPRGTASRVVKGVKTFNVATQLGDIVLSSAPDVVRPIAITGFMPYAKGIAKFASQVFRDTPSKANINRFGIAVERTLNTRQAQMTMMKDPTDRVLPLANRIWGMASGFNVWTDTWESITAYAVQDHVIRNAQKLLSGKTLKQADITRLARAGLDEDMLLRIAEMTKNEKGILKEGKTAQWADYEAARSFEGAVISDVHMAIIRPGAGDIITLMDNEYASLMGQYTSFGFASTNRMLVNGMQLKDLRAAEALLLSVVLGSLVGASKAYKRGDDPAKWSSEKWVFEGVDRSGILGIYRFLNSWAAAGMGETPSRYLTRDAESIIGGPTVGTVGKVARLGMAGAEAITTGDTKALEDTKHLRLIPYANSMGMLDTMIQLGK